MKICQVLKSKSGLVQVQVLDNGHLCWSLLQRNDKSMHLSTEIKTIPIEDILHIKFRPVKQTTQQSGTEDSGSSLRTHRLLVHYVHHKKKQTLRMGTCHFDGTLVECERLADDINSKRGETLTEGRTFLALINPVSGYSRSHRIYRSIVAPLLKACDIHCDVIVSSKSGSMERSAQTHSLQGYSGLLVLGGDGSVNEVVSGLLLRAMEEGGQDVNDVNCQLLPSTVPVGIIPTGSGNSLCNYMQGNHDIITAVIHIIRGKTVTMNAVTMHEPDRFLGMSFLVQHMGFVGDIIRKGEINRWMGPARYQVASHTSLFHRRLMSAELTCGSSCHSNLRLLQPSSHDTRNQATQPDPALPAPMDQASVKNVASTPVDLVTEGRSKGSVLSSSSHNTSTQPSTSRQSEHTWSDFHGFGQGSTPSRNKSPQDQRMNQEKRDGGKTQVPPDENRATTDEAMVSSSSSTDLPLISAVVGESETSNTTSWADVPVNTTAPKEGEVGSSCTDNVLFNNTKASEEGDVLDRLADVPLGTEVVSEASRKPNAHSTQASSVRVCDSSEGGSRSLILEETHTDRTAAMDIDVNDHIQAEMHNIFIAITQHLTPEGRLGTHLGHDTMTLMVVKKCSMPSFIKHMTKVRDNAAGIDQFSFVECREVDSLKLELTTPQTQKQSWYINSDGQSITLRSFVCYFKLHPRVFRAFGPGTQWPGLCSYN